MLRGMVIRKKWRLTKRLGKGGYGEVYLGLDFDTNEQVAVKLEKIGVRERQALKMEVEILGKIQESPYSTKLIDYGHTQEYNYLVMELLGANLSALKKRSRYDKFSLSTTLKLGILMIEAIQAIHEAGYVHRDIKPANFLLRTPEKRTSGKAMLTIIDFGLAKELLNSDGSLKLKREKVGFRGTARYSSYHAHFKRDLGRRDDMWSLLYILIEFYTGTLPWSGIKEKEKIADSKKELDSLQLVRGLPPQFADFLKHIQKLGFYDAPDYDYLKTLLADCYKENGYDDTTKFDWELGGNNGFNSDLPSSESRNYSNVPGVHVSSKEEKCCKCEMF